MPPAKGPLWQFFLAGEKQNASHVRAYCHGCLEAIRPKDDAVELDGDGNAVLRTKSWVVEGMHYSLESTESNFNTSISL